MDRIWKASDGVRTVKYNYTDGYLTKVTTPAGKETSYQYGPPSIPTDWTLSYDVAGPVMTRITDPRGMAIDISYQMALVEEPIFLGQMPGVIVYCVAEPNGCKTWFRYRNVDPTSDNEMYVGAHDFNDSHIRIADTQDSTGATINRLGVAWALDETSQFPVVVVQVDHGIHSDWREGVGDGPAHFYQYDIFSQNLMKEWSVTVPVRAAGFSMGPDVALDYNRRLIEAEPINRSWGSQRVTTETVYNFMGHPLSRTVTEASYAPNSSLVSSVSRSVEYAYWGSSKYYQQKAVRSKKDATTWRYSFTDYYDDQAATGKKGMTYRVYDDKRADFSLGTSWKYDIAPTSSGAYSAQFDYDSKGRPIDVWKLQSTTTTPWTYVQTHTEYGADSSPTWGAATSVVEDYGTGKINRTTQTMAYDSIGRAVDVLDAAGHQFHTNYDLDGQVQSVYRVDGSHNEALVSYVYGTSGITNGVRTQVTDGLSGVVQSFAYNGLSSGGATGQPSSVTETNGADSYTVSYTYHPGGERKTATYATPDGTTRWGYYDYISLGDPASATRAFRTLSKLDSSGNPTSEEFHYQFDSSGRLREATFAMTPQAGHGYEASYPAATRARAHYTYDPAGRTTNVEHYWDVWTVDPNNSANSHYESEPVLGNHCDYDAVKGLKSQSDFYVKNPTSNAWLLERSETYGYDADLDYLTSASYGDGLANENPTWSYDAAGNRNDCTVVDNLNRATTIGGVSRTYDILGNTLTKGSITYGWDCLNRMTSHPGTVSGQGIVYAYRADGMRTLKGTVVLSNQTPTFTERYRYDGQMPVETSRLDVQASATTVTRNGLGARGIDYMSSTTSSGTSVSYPVYDAHGNMVATLAKSGSGYAVSNRRAYDAWGGIRQGNTTGEPKGRYCASIGHLQDDESGLVYMRARYYESASGRFVSEDPQGDGDNWFVYCSNQPVTSVDPTGALKHLDEYRAMQEFLQFLLTARDGNEVETAWAKCIKAFQVGNGQVFVGIVGEAWRLKNYIFAIARLSAVGMVMYTFATIVAGIAIGAHAYMLEVAYMGRVAWYIDDIDRD